MCIVCLEFEKDKMTRKEAIKALGEMVTFPSSSSTEEQQEHFKQIIDKLSEEESTNLIDYYDTIGGD